MNTALVHFNHLKSENLTSWPDMRTSVWKPNYGDILVCKAIFEELKLEDTVGVNFGQILSKPVGRAIIRGSTYLHNEFDFEAANKTLDSIDAPLTIVGLGAQNPIMDLSFLDNNVGAREFIARLNEKSVSISVRGDFTASVVERLGGRNIRVTGCPSLFYALSAPVVRISEMLAMPERSIGISIHTGLEDNIFCHAPNETLAMHGELISWALENSEALAIFEQGVLHEYDISDHDLSFAKRRKAASEVIERIKATDFFSPERLMAHMVSLRSVEEWLAKTRNLDAMIGFRFHGNMVALLQGKPCYYYVYDSRLTELCDIYCLPYQDVTEDWRDPINEIIEHDWGITNSRFKFCFDEIKAFYAENGFIDRFN